MTLIIENSGAFVVWCNDLVTHKEGATFIQDWIVKTLQHLFKILSAEGSTALLSYMFTISDLVVASCWFHVTYHFRSNLNMRQMITWSPVL